MLRLGLTILGSATLLTSIMSAQQALPDAPSARMFQPSESYSSSSHRSYFRRIEVKPAKELLADDPYVPLNRHEKLEAWAKQAYAPTTFIGVGVDTAFSSVMADFRYCCGADAWGKQYGAALADTEARRFFGRFLFPTLMGQDPRYLPKRRGNVAGRMWYAATRVLVTRNDEGISVFNSSELASVAFSKALCNAYYPDRDRSGMGTASRILGTYQSDVTNNLLTEFWPDIKSAFKRHAPPRLARFTQRMPMVKLGLN